MEPLSEILNQVYVSGTVFGHARFRGDWAVFTRGADTAIFHAVQRGEATIVWDEGRRSMRLAQGSVVVVPRGIAHIMCADPAAGVEPTWIRDVFTGDDGVMTTRADHGEGPVRTTLICGTFRFDERTPNRLLAALPDVVYVDGDEQRGWVERTLMWIGDELESSRPGSDVIVNRLTDTLFVYILRACLERAVDEHTPWLGALTDPGIARALAAMHAQPGDDWTAASLARAAGMSRSAFYTRFTELVGEPPSQYLWSRRMDVAAHALRAQSRGVADVAAAVGYRSESSFSKAFKRYFGVSPSEYRAA